MSKPLAFPALAQLAAATAGRNMTKAAYVAVSAGVLMLLLLTVDPAYEAAHHWVDAVLWACLAFFVFEWLVRLRDAFMTEHGWSYALSGRGMVDAVAAAAVPLALVLGATPKTAWLLGVFWVLKVVPGIPGLRQLRRVLVLESGPLLSVLVIFLMVLFLASVAVYFLERDAQPVAFGSVPAALWWAVATLSTTGYGDVVPVTPLGRVVAAFVMICGLGVFGLWTGILATGFAAETRRDNFLKTWESVSKVPFFAALGPSAIADVTHMLRTMDLPARTTIIRKGQAGDCMYFIAAGEVEVDLPGKKITLGGGARNGRSIRARSILSVWSLSTRPGPRPTWQPCGAGRRAATDSQPRSRTATGRPQPSWPRCATTGSRHHGFSMARSTVRASRFMSRRFCSRP
ncbi:MAG: cyclic nucleotide-gated ion channel [Bradyrhizobium sp.]